MCWASEIDATTQPAKFVSTSFFLAPIKLAMSLAKFMQGQVKHETVGSGVGVRQLQNLAAFFDEAL
jgi:hypothetical protein